MPTQDLSLRCSESYIPVKLYAGRSLAAIRWAADLREQGAMRLRLVAFALVAYAGCESDYGVNRGAELGTMPDPSCVSRAIHRTTGVSSVEERRSQESQRYRYEGDGFWAHVYFYQESDGTVVFLHRRVSVNERPATKEVATTRQMMRAVEKSIASDCGVPEFGAGVWEECIGVRCGRR